MVLNEVGLTFLVFYDWLVESKQGVFCGSMVVWGWAFIRRSTLVLSSHDLLPHAMVDLVLTVTIQIIVLVGCVDNDSCSDCCSNR